jgi:predicted flap endonuclease-1-like 5' DNA nuclease
MRGISIALGEIAFFLVLAGVFGIGIGFLLRDWLFANRADKLDEMLREERTEYRRLESGAATREHQLQRTIVAREALIEELQAGQQPEALVLSNRPFRPGSVLRPPAGVAVPVGAPTNGDAEPPAEPEHDVPLDEDDLQQIRGVGPTISRRLNEQGITTYRQLATLTENEVGALADTIRIARGRITRDDWVGAAAALDEEAYGPRR